MKLALDLINGKIVLKTAPTLPYLTCFMNQYIEIRIDTLGLYLYKYKSIAEKLRANSSRGSQEEALTRSEWSAGGTARIGQAVISRIARPRAATGEWRARTRSAAWTTPWSRFAATAAHHFFVVAVIAVSFSSFSSSLWTYFSSTWSYLVTGR